MRKGKLIQGGAFLSTMALLLAGCGGSGGEASLSAPGVAPTIVGGTPVSEGAYPAQVALLSKSQSNVYQAQFCGGTLIGSQWVITAAHCVQGTAASSIDIGVGITNLPDGPAPEKRVAVSSIKVHPSYNGSTNVNDVALIKLASTVSQRPLPYAGPTRGSLYNPGTTAVAVGWGATSEGGPYPTQMYKVNLPLIDDATCAGAYSGFSDDAMVCAGNVASGGIDTCQGDSGGPLMVNGVLIGLTSFGIGCARPGYPGVYTEVKTYASFIQSTTGVAPY